MKKQAVLVSRIVTDEVKARASDIFEAVFADHDMDAEEMIRATIDLQCPAVLIGPKSKLGADQIGRLPGSLRIIANSSVGYDHMDAEAARGRGIIVTNTPDVLTDCTADLALMLILNACRRGAEYEAVMRKGWRTNFGMTGLLGLRPSGRTLGIVGMGRIGQAVAKRARGFDMRILYHNRRALAPDMESGAQYFADFREMLPHCDILSLHLPAGPSVGTLMTAEMFALLPRGAVFVNTARGSLVDEDALFEALRSGQVFAAGLDVFRCEPDFDLRFAELPNVFLTPHMGSATVDTRNAMGMKALDNILAVLSGRPPIDPV